jgi:hypothetical protein
MRVVSLCGRQASCTPRWRLANEVTGIVQRLSLFSFFTPFPYTFLSSKRFFQISP